MHELNTDNKHDMVNDNHQVVNSEINHVINNDHAEETFERSPYKDLSL
jgi:hypothetical protein